MNIQWTLLYANNIGLSRFACTSIQGCQRVAEIDSGNHHLEGTELYFALRDPGLPDIPSNGLALLGRLERECPAENVDKREKTIQL